MVVTSPVMPYLTQEASFFDNLTSAVILKKAGAQMIARVLLFFSYVVHTNNNHCTTDSATLPCFTQL